MNEIVAESLADKLQDEVVSSIDYNIEMENGKPKWIKSCVHCMACINRCPKQAIEYGKGTVGKTRYVCKKYSKIQD